MLEVSFKNGKGKRKPMFGKKRPDFSKWVKSHPRYGQSNPNYIDGRSFYPYAVEFNKQLKARIRRRDNYTCQYCNMVEIEHKTRYNDSLTIHHIDYNKNNCHINNLITLCYICNSKSNYNRDYWYAYFTYLMERE